MAYSAGTLVAYVKEDERLIFTRSLFEAKTQKMIQSMGNVMVEVKSAETVNKMTTDAAFQDDSGCAFEPSGTTAFTQRTLTVGKIKVEEALCPKTLEAYYLQKALPAGGTYTEAVFAKEYMDLKTATIAEQLETAIWQGDTASTDINLNKFDGLSKIIQAASGVINANSTPYVSATVTSVDVTNAVYIVKAIKNALPAKVKGKADVRIFCGWDVFDLIVDAHVNANLFNYGQGQLSDGEFKIPGTQYIVTAVHGLDGANDFFAMRVSNMFFGTDLLDENDNVEMWYSQDNRNVRLHIGFKAGVQVAFPDEIVKFIIA
jgi:hypothetical protein